MADESSSSSDGEPLECDLLDLLEDYESEDPMGPALTASGDCGSLSLSNIKPVRKHEVSANNFNLSLLPEPLREPVQVDQIEGCDACVLHGVLSEEHCNKLISEAEACGFSFWDGDNENPRTDFRNAHTVEVTSEAIAQSIWERMSEFFPDTELINEEEYDRWERDIEGEWFPTGLNPTLLFGRYKSGGHFAPHTDGNTIIDFNHRSLRSVIIYLSDCKGGETAMQTDEQLTNLSLDDEGRYAGSADFEVAKVSPAPGRVLTFFQNIVHEGRPPTDGTVKYIIRTDIMYERRPGICDSEKDLEAYRMYLEAKECEAVGDTDRALSLYRRMVKMSPGLADVFGL